MALNIKDPETARLAAEVAAMAGESKTRAVRVALEERKRRLELEGRKPKRSLREFLEQEVWPLIPPEQRGQPPMTKAEREQILGYGPDGV
ncbi:MAG TPA: type II toxin-antitoxin system VapB family antitoxin [Chloroflexota bacterium]|nr:type II toxin-antitoxin system VapB family antitoxin [Chloroflexota bacterium]